MLSACSLGLYARSGQDVMKHAVSAVLYAPTLEQAKPYEYSLHSTIMRDDVCAMAPAVCN